MNVRKFSSQQGNATIFDKIISKQIPAKIIYEDNLSLCFLDINPQAPFHALLIPKEKQELDRLINAQEKHQEILGHLLVTASKIAKQNNLEKGWRLVINDGENGGQTVYHLHLHILGGKALGWPPYQEKLKN